MTAAVGKYAAKKLMNSQLKKYQHKEPAGAYDPYYEYRADPRNPRKQKKFKKQIPAYIPEHDAKILAEVRKRAYKLDMALFEFLGIRFGWSSVIGLVPEVGDVIDMAMALSLMRKCGKIEGGLPQSIKSRMLLYILVDFLIGLVPFVGDMLDASIKANTWNCRLLEQHLDKKYKPKTAQELERREREDARRSGVEYFPPAPATVYEDISSDEELPQYTTNPNTPGRESPRHPAPARQPEERRGGERTERRLSKKSGGGGWFSGAGGSRRERTTSDVEMAEPRRDGSRRY